MRIPLSAPDIRETDIAAVVEVLRQPRLSLGARQEEFESAVADYVGVSRAVAVNSGTSGLHIVLHALGIGPGDEVILPSFSFIAPANAVRYRGATPVFVEIDPETLTLDPECVEKAITPRTRAIVAIHTFGYPAEMTALQAIARASGIFLVEDACEALGAEYEGRKAGSFGDAAVFAFYPNKQITTGEGGMVVTDSASLAARLRSLRNQGRVDAADWFQHAELGYSYRLSEFQCALGVEQMKRMDFAMRRREAIARAYRDRLAGNADWKLLPPDGAGRRTSWFTFPVRLSERFDRRDRDRIAVKMAEAGIECGRYFAPIHQQPAYRNALGARADLLLTERHAERCLALPLFLRITDDEIAQVCERLSAMAMALRSCAAS
jgi:perosamine synthetase